jgi:8-oxo-dGTP pyrophosphatase MutT (NUDIX family)
LTLAAGILFITKDNQALFLKRGPGGDYPGYWCFPGGHTEDDETPEQTAIRETKEEIGFLPKGDRVLHTRSISNPNPLSPPPEGVVGPAPAVANPPATAGATSTDFTTFAQRIETTFEPKLDGEHVGFAWAPITEPPQPLHPGCEIALRRFSMNELDVARAMSEGLLTSPQTYSNMSLFAIRITGTGAAYRSGIKEYVWRDPSMYLNDEFLQRCNGLAVIFEHPKSALLNSQEFSDRIIGTILLPYIKGDEVWGIAKIYDVPSIQIMNERQLSTSPAVTWRDLNANVVFKREDGSKLLIEGEPSLLDHIAVCDLGVWDKGGKPSGVLVDSLTVERTDSEMADEKDKDEKTAADEARAKADAEAGQKLDKLLSMQDSIMSKCDAMSARMDAFEEKEKAREDAVKRKDEPSEKEELKEAAKRGASFKGPKGDDPPSRRDGDDDEKEKAKAKDDAEDEDDEPKEVAADKKKRKDADEDDKDEKKADRADSADIAAIRAQVDELAKKMPRAISDADHAAFADAQARADDVFRLFGKAASRPLMGEDLVAYRKRLTRQLQAYSPTWKETNLDVVAVVSAAFEVIERDIYNHARNAAYTPDDLPEGQLRAVVRSDHETGRNVTEFVGNGSFVRDFAMPAQYVTKIVTDQHRNSQ